MVLDIEKCIYWEQEKKNSFSEYDFLMPDISIGNVGQLTVDLLLNNLKVEHLGRIVHPCFFPFIGGDPFHVESTRLTSSCEIYECVEKKLVILQIRSRVFPHRFSEFENLIMHFLKKFQFKETILIASSSSEYFSAEQLRSVPLHYLQTSKCLKNNIFDQLEWKIFSFPENVDVSLTTSIPGSFLSSSLLENCEREKMALTILIFVCSEGDNYPEALHMIKSINSWLKLKQQTKNSEEVWEMPVSWRSPYGSAPPRTMY